MSRADLWHLALAISLTTIAGYVDAVGLLKLGNFFVSFMSGNSTQFGVSLGHGHFDKALQAGIIIALFVVGVIAGHLWAKGTGQWRRPAVLIVDAALLGLAALIASSPFSFVPMVLAMGLQNAALHKAGEIKTSLTYVTGSLVSFGENIADAFDSGKRWAWVPYLLLWAGMVVGAMIGARFYASIAVRALIWPALIVTLFAAITAAAVGLGVEDGKAEE